MKKIIKIEPTNPETSIYWILTDFCNQKCSYCPPTLNSGIVTNNRLNPSDDKIRDFLNKLSLISHTNHSKKLVINLAGGEPTTHPMFKEIVHSLKQHSIVRVVTNGTRNVSYWSSLESLPDSVCISLHPEYYDNKKYRINELSEFLCSNGVQIQYNLMCHPEMWDQVLAVYNDLDEKFKPYVVGKVVHDLNHKSRSILQYSPEQLEFIKKIQKQKLNIEDPIKIINAHYSDGSVEFLPSANKLMVLEQNYFKDWKCSAGSEIISVTPRGQVYAGICASTLLGTIENFDFLTEYIICPKKTCTCPADIYVSKYKISTSGAAARI